MHRKRTNYLATLKYLIPVYGLIKYNKDYPDGTDCLFLCFMAPIGTGCTGGLTIGVLISLLLNFLC